MTESMEMPEGALTEDDLVARLRALDATVTKRRVAKWRENGLLPDFDVPGAGRGRGLGRSPALWSDGQRIYRQAVTILELLEWHERVESAYLPLWLLGYEVPVETVREKLLEEIILLRDGLAEGLLESGMDAEDFYYEVACRLCESCEEYWERGGAAASESLSDEQVEMLMDFDEAVNVVSNPDHTLVSPVSPLSEFARRHLSLSALYDTVTGASPDDLLSAQKDLGFAIEIVTLVFSSASPANFPNKYGALTTFGRLAVLADLAMRRAGYGEQIDEHLPLFIELARLKVEERILAAGASTETVQV